MKSEKGFLSTSGLHRCPYKGFLVPQTTIWICWYVCRYLHFDFQRSELFSFKLALARPQLGFLHLCVLWLWQKRYEHQKHISKPPFRCARTLLLVFVWSLYLYLCEAFTSICVKLSLVFVWSRSISGMSSTTSIGKFTTGWLPLLCLATCRNQSSY